MTWQWRSGFKRLKPSFALGAVLAGIFCGLIVGFSDLPFPMFSTATQGAADALGALVSPNCQIKGNISVTTGERIYHIPGGQFYVDTRIDALKGERWFCKESEAQAAGWRRSKN